MPRILLKARPIPEQIRDRLLEPQPDGLELYLDLADISGSGWLKAMRSTVGDLCPSNGFALVVEGPLRSLDGEFFDLTRDSKANREVVRRVITSAEAVGAEAAVLHLIAPRSFQDGYSEGVRKRALESALDLVGFYAEQCRRVGVTATLENVPPVARMRENQYLQSLVGMDPADLLYVVGRVPGLRITLDVSHAKLYLNLNHIESWAEEEEIASAGLGAVLGTAYTGCSQLDLDAYISLLAGDIEEAHISNASGVLGEGLPYDDGEMDLDGVVSKLVGTARFLVTETIEPDPASAVHMRYAQKRMSSVLDRLRSGEGA